MNGRTRYASASSGRRMFIRRGLILVTPVVLALAVLPSIPASATSAISPSNVVRLVTTVSPRAVPGLYRCATSTTCDTANANVRFVNYSSVCLYQDCNFVAVADWIKVKLGIDLSTATLKSEYAKSGQTFRSGPTTIGLWPYWRKFGIGGSLATKVVPYPKNRAGVQSGVTHLGALIAELVSKKNSYMGSLPNSGGTSILVVDGFDPRGPLIVYEATTVQMTWAQWNEQVRGVWGVTAATPISPFTSTVTFNANGGSGTTPSESASTATALTPNGFTDAGHHFVEWNTEPDGRGTNYANEAVYSFSTSVTLYAQWSISASLAPTTVTVVFNANGGTGVMSPEVEPLNATAPITTNTFTRTGYTFVGWSTSANGSGSVVSDGQTVQFTSSITLYAQWASGSVSVPFSGLTSTNWAGYILPTNSPEPAVSAKWTVPTLNCVDTPNSSSATWIGTGGSVFPNGSSTGALLQTGVQDNCVDGYQIDLGWFELVPSSPNQEEQFANFPVSPGDSISAEVGYINGKWGTILENLSTGLTGVFLIGGSWEVVNTATLALIPGTQGNASSTTYSGAYSVEWIQEDATNASNGSLSAFSNYGSVTFSNMETNISGWSVTSSDACEMVQGGTLLSVPGPVTNGGFVVKYTGP